MTDTKHQKPTKIESEKLYTKTEAWVLNPEDLDLESDDWWNKAIFHSPDNDTPAIVVKSIETGNAILWEWYKEGNLHRENDLPSIENISGSKWWYNNGKKHRGNKKPAVICHDHEEYWTNGKNPQKEKRKK